MPLKVLPANEADASRAVDIENIAYGPNPIGSVLFPNPRPSGPNTRVADLIDLFQKNPACRWAKVVDTDIGEDEMVAFTMWYMWDTPPTEEQHSFSSYRGPSCNVEACELLFGGINKMRVSYMNGKPYAFLKLLHTDPKHQRRGAASLLLEWGLKEADRLGIPACLESSSQGRKLYEKFGFDEAATHTVDFSRWDGPSEVTIPLMTGRGVNNKT
ncbi:hypothetical protein FSARC_1247 [Fusarium sarcochroum]|uniref:N-acetyltransferase domain-containing protein n=1 Tax=Fusarium sarcochroum TaxID=1208366 RepID=A0A8H4XEF3_9HYPO|nr:hypothetical protein FSARC_1247 [Fusarium sarcochroum]